MGKLIEIEQAWEQIDAASASSALEPIELPVEQAVGRVLAESVVSDIDVPPYRKALMDGYAVSSGDVEPGVALPIRGEILAGSVPKQPLEKGTAVRIMTGAPLPRGADAVVPVEQTQREGDQVLFEGTITAGANLMEQGFCTHRGETVMPAGATIAAHHVGLLCEVGAARVHVRRPPRVAVLSTGDELVSPTDLPSLGQIRNTNAPLLGSLAERDGAHVSQLGVAVDEAEELAARIGRGLQHDVLLLSGGVSAGVRDLVPATLEGLGVEPVFHGVRLKPGKPVFFGVRPGSPPTFVFGLPGNPVSSWVCYELFVRRTLDHLSGRGLVERWQERTVAEDFAYCGSRRTLHPAKLAGRDAVRLLSWKGSVDQRVLSKTDALVDLLEAKGVAAGELVRVYVL